ncbi:MAG: ABC transporter ATP-binding protein [Rhizobiales bacterium]|nr:ABC transporter ATP-binding protein [Hyphomicrobiales bacterium]
MMVTTHPSHLRSSRPGLAGSASGLPVSIISVTRAYGPVKAVDDVSLNVLPGEFVSLLGPSGSGKTTLLMMLAGFDNPSAGQLVVGDRDLARVPANKRNLGMVFQRYALFPHMTVSGNIAFPLRMRGVSGSERDRLVRRALDMVKLTGYADRMPGQLSGGQQQRVALARAIVFEPPVVLMDEPLGALDKKLRQHLQIEIKELQERLGATVLFVTHDQEEALTMSDRIAVLNNGQLMQCGSPQDLYDRPANAFVADFLGDMNFLPGVSREIGTGTCRIQVGSALLAARLPCERAIALNSRVRIAVRPERIALSRLSGSQSPGPGLTGTIVQRVFHGAAILLMVSTRDPDLTFRVVADAHAAEASLEIGENVSVDWSADDAHVFSEAA